MKRKLFLLGSASILAPAFTVISCGINKYATEDEQKLYRDLTSETAIKVLESKWQYKVLNSTTQDLVKKYKISKIVDGKPSPTETVDVYSPNIENETVKKIAIGIIQKHINKDIKYLEKLSVELLGSGVEKSEKLVPDLTSPVITKNVYDKEWLTENGLMNIPLFASEWKPFDTSAHTLTLNGLKLLASDNRLNFKNELLKALMTYQYITNVNKSQWAKVHVKESANLSSQEELIDSSQFILVKESLSKRYFAKWNIELDENKSRKYSTPELSAGLTTVDALAQINISNKTQQKTIVYDSGYKNQKTLSTNNIYDFSGDADIADYSELAGYKGFANQSIGPDNLKFEDSNLKAATSSSYWRGFLMPTKFVEYDKTKTSDEFKDVKLFKENGSTAGLTFVKGIMPIYKDETLKFDSKKDATFLFFSIYDEDLYSEAKKYYLTEVKSEGTSHPGKEAIILEFNDTAPVQKYKKILEDKGVDFLEAKDPE